MSIYNLLRTLILPYSEIDTHLPNSGKIIDLGCGQGILSNYLAGKGERSVIGVDKNIDRLPISNFKNLKYIGADITKYNLTNIDGVVLSDVLHHLDRSDQIKLLKKIYLKTKKNGVLIIKEVDTSEFIRGKLSRFWDFVFYPQDKIHFSNRKELKTFLTNLGFKVRIIPCKRFFPGSTTLYICKKY